MGLNIHKHATKEKIECNMREKNDFITLHGMGFATPFHSWNGICRSCNTVHGVIISMFFLSFAGDQK